MSRESDFNNQIKSNYAFVAKTVFELHSLIQAQSEELYKEKEMGFPVWLSSTLLFLSQVDNASISQIAKALNFPHQLVSQRVKMLLKLGLIAGSPAPDDKRKTLYQLTMAGKEQSKILDLYCVDAANAFTDLSQEVGVDIQAILNDAITALKRKSFGERFPNHGKTYAQQVAAKQA